MVSWSVAGRVVSFILVADLINFNLYYGESKEIYEVYDKIRAEQRKKELEELGHPDAIYLKTSDDSSE